MSRAPHVIGRRRAAAELHEREESYRRFFEENLTGVCVGSPDGRILECNPAFARIFGFPSVDAARAASLPELFPKREDRRELLEVLESAEELERHEVEGRRLSGEPVYVVANVVAERDERGGLTAFRAYLFDDTDRRKAEQQLLQAQRLEAVGRLAGGVAHDFNNLMTVMAGYSDLCLMTLPEDSPERKHLEEIKHAGERAAGLARQLLAFSRMQVLKPEVFDLNVVVERTERMLRRLIGEDVRLTTRLASDLPPVEADPGQLEQVVVNLAINARDAMPRGGELAIETGCATLTQQDGERFGFAVVPGDYLLLTVRDTGTGMPPEVREKVFEPFFTTKERGRGTGLGLSTVYGIVKQTGGYILIDSFPARGTTVDVYLPRAREAQPSSSAHRDGGRERVARVAPRRRQTILVVEDEEPLRRLLVEILARHDYAVVEASGGRQALELCARHDGSLDLVITDVVMPDMQGPRLERELAKRHPGVQVLLISGYAGKTVVRQGELAQERPFLQKPFDQETLLRTVRNVIGATE
ncbi:MAG: ATP-binding protein [bacterium]